MKVKVRLFGHLAERAGRGELTVDAPGPTAADVIAAVRRDHPSLPLSAVSVAVNEEYADGRARLRPGDVVSLLPPVGGG